MEKLLSGTILIATDFGAQAALLDQNGLTCAYPSNAIQNVLTKRLPTACSQD